MRRKPFGDVIRVTTVTTTLAPSEPRLQLTAFGLSDAYIKGWSAARDRRSNIHLA